MLQIYDLKLSSSTTYLSRHIIVATASVRQAVLIHDPICLGTTRSPSPVEHQCFLYPDKLPRLCSTQYLPVRACGFPETPFGRPVWSAAIPSFFFVQSHKEVPLSLPSCQLCKLVICKALCVSYQISLTDPGDIIFDNF
jgi:hypothetical protein